MLADDVRKRHGVTGDATIRAETLLYIVQSIYVMAPFLLYDD